MYIYIVYIFSIYIVYIYIFIYGFISWNIRKSYETWMKTRGPSISGDPQMGFSVCFFNFSNDDFPSDFHAFTGAANNIQQVLIFSRIFVCSWQSIEQIGLLVGGFKHYSFSILYMGCHPSHWLSYFSEGFKPPTRLLLYNHH